MKTINESKRLQVIGLLTLAKDYNTRLDDIARSIAGIVDEPDGQDGGHTGDTVYSHVTQETPVHAAKMLFDRLKISVTDEEDAS